MKTRKIPSDELKSGMVVKTPETYRDEHGEEKKMADLWPAGEAPKTLEVIYWDADEGETELSAGDGTYVDFNTADYPDTFEVVEDA